MDINYILKHYCIDYALWHNKFMIYNMYKIWVNAYETEASGIYEHRSWAGFLHDS